MTRPDLIPSPSPNIKNDAIKISVQSINSSFNRLKFESDSSQSNCASGEKVARGSAEERRRVNSDGALGKMIPRIIIFGYKDYAVVNKKWIATCKTGGKKITDGGATSNSVRHLKLHKER